MVKKYSITQIRKRLKDFVPVGVSMSGWGQHCIEQIIATIKREEYKEHTHYVCAN